MPTVPDSLAQPQRLVSESVVGMSMTMDMAKWKGRDRTSSSINICGALHLPGFADRALQHLLLPKFRRHIAVTCTPISANRSNNGKYNMRLLLDSRLMQSAAELRAMRAVLLGLNSSLSLAAVDI